MLSAKDAEAEEEGVRSFTGTRASFSMVARRPKASDWRSSLNLEVSSCEAASAHRD